MTDLPEPATHVLSGGGHVFDDEITAFGRALLVVGDQWSMLVIREAFAGATKFSDFKARLAVSDTVLARRLADLTGMGIFETRQYSDKPPRVEYVLTDCGLAMWRIFVAIWDWEARWVRDVGPRSRLIHTSCGNSATPLLACGSCGAAGITPRDTIALQRPDTSINQSNPARPYRRSSLRPDADSTHLHPELLDLLGDRWTVSVLGAAMLRLRRFGEMQEALGISPILLSERLADFVQRDVMMKTPVVDGGRRQEYRLRPKGRDMMTIFVTTNDWGNHWFPDPEGESLRITHAACNQPLKPRWRCNACGDELTRETTTYTM